MKISMMSDMHGQLPSIAEVPKCDVLLISGDVCPDFGRDFFLQVAWLDSVFKPWLAQLKNEKVFDSIVGIAGNHDRCFELAPKLVEEVGLSWTYLQDSSVRIGGLKFYGTPWTPRCGAWSFMLNDVIINRNTSDVEYNRSLGKVFDMISKDVDVLLSHGPPYGILDQPLPYREEHLGSFALKRAIENSRPYFVVFGHIHGGYGATINGHTNFFNVSLFAEHYVRTNKIRTLDTQKI